MDFEYAEPYVKEKNLLQLPVFSFSKRRPIPIKTSYPWTETFNGELVNCLFECHCKYGVPGSFEQDVYAACMRIWVEDGMPSDGIEISYSQIARKLNLFPERSWSTKIKKALEKLAQARYEFIKCFIAEGERQSHHFSLFDEASLFSYDESNNKGNKSKKRGRSILRFPDELRRNFEAKYYQYLDMAWYKALPSGLPRRLYEYLAKMRYHGIDRVFKINKEKICRWLPIDDSNLARRVETLQDTADALIKAGYLESYSFDGDRELCTFTYATAKILPESQDSLPVEPSRPSDAAPAQSPKPTQSSKPTPSDAAPAPSSKPSPKSIPSESPNLVDADAMLWLLEIPGMQPAIAREIAKSPHFSERFSSVKAEFERQSGKIENPLGWLRKAFEVGYQKTERQQKNDAAAQKRSELQEFMDAIKARIEDGEYGLGKQQIESITPDGIILVGDADIAVRFVPWQIAFEKARHVIMPGERDTENA